MIIAIDGPAASGKGTLARRIAARLGFHHLDTGLLYRAIARVLIERGAAMSDEAAAVAAAEGGGLLGFPEEVLKGAQMGEAASIVAAFPGVRAAILNMQRDFGRRPPGAVLDGRDVGTTIFPDADVKLFVTASAEERARRRARELREQGEEVEEASILADIRRRDERDRTRAIAPLRPAPDAVLLDTTDLDIEAAFRAAVEVIGRARLRLAEPRIGPI